MIYKRALNGLPRIYASDTLYPAGSDPWSGTPTKFRKSDALHAAGRAPNDPDPAQYHNQDLYEFSHATNAIDLVDAQNYPERYGFDPAGAENSQLVKGYAVAIGDPRVRLIFCGDTDTIYASYNGGFSFASELSAAGVTWAAIDHADVSIAAVGDHAGGRRLYATQSQAAPAWAFVTLADCTTISTIEADPFNGKYLSGGLRTTGSDPCIWSSVDAAGTIGAVTQISRAGTETITKIAAGGALNLAAGDTELHVWADGDAALSALTFGGGGLGSHTIRALVWDSVTEAFIVLTDDGAGTARSWTVKEGNPAVLRSTIAGFEWGPPTGTKPAAIAARGSAVVAAARHDASGGRFLAITTDAGTTWDFIPDPLKSTGTGGGSADCIEFLHNRFVVAGYQAAGVHVLALGLRTGPLR